MNINFIILGGTNNEKGELNNYTKNRIIKCYQMLSNLKDRDITIHFSGGFNEKFNKTNISHSKICFNYFEELNKNKYNVKKELHINNNNTVDEAINFGKYFQNYNSEIKIITNDWHSDRVKYLFKKVFDFYEISNYEIIGVESNILDKNLLDVERTKIKELKEKPYGLWKKWLVNNYYSKYLNLRLIKKNESDGKIIVNMRNENNEYFFDTSKFNWESFKNIFYNKYFSNEIPPFFVCLDKEVLGFIGCKTIEPNINDIGIMFFKKFQNKGFGKVSLNKFLEIYKNNYYNNKKKIISKILKKNIASYKKFISNKFKLDETKTTDEIYYLTF